MIVLRKDINGNIIEEKFINMYKLGETLAYRLCLGYEVTVELYDRFGNGTLFFTKKGENEAFVDFKEFNTFDSVQISYNKLGTIKRLYK